MRPGQQNNSNNNNNNNNKNRSRGRNNNNGGRKHLNPLSRNYESNGPDVKVRGNAAHVAEKYVQLARDAHGSGDSVMAENYLQHAEHYFRIVLASQPQGLPRTDQFGQDYEGDAEGDDYAGDEQSRFDTPAYRANLQNDRSYQDDRQPRPEQQQVAAAQPQAERPPQQRDDRQPRFDQQQAPRLEPQQISDPEAEIETREAGGEAVADAAPTPDSEPRRVRERRPRRRRPAAGEAAGVDPAGPQPDIGELPAFITAGGTPNPAE